MPGVFRSGYQALANAVWSLVALGSRTVTCSTMSDKVTYSGAVTDKSGYSLTAGSYSIRASSTTATNITIADTATTANGSISPSVTTTRAVGAMSDSTTTRNDADMGNMMRGRITGTSTFGVTRITSAGTATSGYSVIEFY